METATRRCSPRIRPVKIDDVNVFIKPDADLRAAPHRSEALVRHRRSRARSTGLNSAYLSGAPGPQIESRAGFEVDGIEVKVRLDCGGGFVEHRGWYSNAGQ